MPPKKGQKRKAAAMADDSEPLTPPNRETWRGWVEMESEPALFNVMLREMGVRGVKIQEVLTLEEGVMEAILPQPIHALIFLFRYRDTDQAQQEGQTECPSNVWFANQVPDFACASVALLNIVNNIKGLHVGQELNDFREATAEMDPLTRGDAIDTFEFVKRIHNSFARETDLLIADMHVKQKAAKMKKKVSAAKGRQTKEMKKAQATPLSEKSANAATRTSSRTPKKPAKDLNSGSKDSSPLSDPPSGSDYETPSKAKAQAKEGAQGTRRSNRQPKPRQQSEFAASAAATAESEEGFHFVAYMPIDGHVWKLDGLDSFPEDIGTIDAEKGEDWMSIARPAIQTRMMMVQGADIEFNLMAVVHDPAMKERAGLLENVKEIQAIDKKLDGIVEDWRTFEGAETKKEVITASSMDFDISQADIDATTLPEGIKGKLEKTEDLMELVELRKEVIADQAPRRGGIRDALVETKEDGEKARHRRHDYGSFVKAWMGALAEEGELRGLMEDI